MNGTAEEKYTYGISAQGFGSSLNDPISSRVVIDAKKTVINVTGKGDTTALMAFGRGEIVVNGDVEINAPTAIASRGYSSVKINEKGDAEAKINGNIVFAYDGPTSGTAIDAAITLNLDSPTSYWNGNVYIDVNGNPPEDLTKVTGMDLSLSNQANWTTTGDSFLNTFTLNDGIVNLAGKADQTVKIDKLNGSGGTINMAANPSPQGSSLSRIRMSR